MKLFVQISFLSALMLPTCLFAQTKICAESGYSEAPFQGKLKVEFGDRFIESIQYGEPSSSVESYLPIDSLIPSSQNDYFKGGSQYAVRLESNSMGIIDGNLSINTPGDLIRVCSVNFSKKKLKSTSFQIFSCG